MIFELAWWLMAKAASGLDTVFTFAIPDAWHRPVTNAVLNLGAGVFGAVRPVFSDTTWVAILTLCGLALAVKAFRWILALVKIVRGWFP